MARIRSIKPELRTSLTAAQWPREVRYFWVLLWGYMDDHGYGVDEPRLIKADCFPMDDDVTAIDVDKWLDLIAHTVVPGEPAPLCRYEINGRRFIHAPKWADHQRPQHPAISKFPSCSLDHIMSDSGESHETLSGSSSLPGDDLSPEQGAGSREMEQGAGRRAPRPRATVTLLGNALLDEHKRLTKPSLPRDVARRVGEAIDSLLDDPDIKPDEVREALTRLRANRRWGPGMLANLVHEVRQEWAGQGTPQPRASPSVPTTNVRVQSGLDLAAQYAAQEENSERRGIAG